MKKARVCLVSVSDPVSNPRLVKEADALHDAGYDVHVVSGCQNILAREGRFEMRAMPWRWTPVELPNGIARYTRSAIRRGCEILVRLGLSNLGPVASNVHHILTPRLTAAAVANVADLYIAHYIPGLQAAGVAAETNNAKLGFDAEDSHVDELTDIPSNQGLKKAREFIEGKYLKRCVHRTASSPLIANALEKRYGVPFRVLLNVFPLKEAPSQPQRTKYQDGKGLARLYWFSQVIGPGRGLNEIVEIIRRMRTPVELCLRGHAWPTFRNELESQARQAGLGERLFFLSPASPETMVQLSVGFDLGLALEIMEPLNHEMALSNKAFTYMLAGVPIVFSKTPAQEPLAADLKEAAIVIDLNNPQQASELLDEYLVDKAKQESSRLAAWTFAKTKYCWDIEKDILLDCVARALGS